MVLRLWRQPMKKALPMALALALAATPSLAHLDAEAHGAFVAGFSHPFFGLDHVLVMIAVGLWGAVLGARARWALPTAFVGAMVAGFTLALMGAPLPFVEPMILASVLLLGLAVALMLRPPLAAALLATGLFGLFHGHAHGAEVGSAAVLAFGLGFAASTALLHAAGLMIAWGYSYGVRHTRLVRGMGWATALGGLWIAGGL